ncbi:MAG: RNA 3'-terminal phosphate cyclase [Blastocatellia bacterium]|nr:RNA 3'-terminal phosphate cyclase [Blastocatellia bacterium]
MLTIDGSFGEGGGQILRTSLALALVTSRPFRMEKIRAGRKRGGLLRQHLTAVNAATEISGAEVTGASLGSQNLTFVPGRVAAGEYSFAVGTAGSATLVLQTMLPALLTASGASRLTLEGGTHNPFAPPFDFLSKAFLPLVNRIGPRIAARLERPGFYPAGGGKFTITIEPVPALSRLDLPERGKILRTSARAMVANLPLSVAERELAVIRRKMDLSEDHLHAESVTGSRGPGNAVMIEIESEYVTEVFTAFGERGVRAETVAERVVEGARLYLSNEVAVGEHMADQLMVPMAIAGGGSFTTLPLSKHATTNIEIIRKFLNVEIATSPVTDNVWSVEINA